MKAIQAAQDNDAAKVLGYDSAASPPEIIGVMMQMGV